MQKGLVRLLPLLIVAVLLVGVVGYVSVKEIKSGPQSAVLSESDNKTEDFNTSDLDNEEKGLENVGELEVDIPNLKTESPTAKPLFKTIENQKEESVNGDQKEVSETKRGFSLFDFFDSLLKQLNSLRF